MKTVNLNIDINRAMSICVLNNIKVYPVISGKRFVVEVNNNGKIIKGAKVFSNKEIANACSKTYKYFAKQIIAEDNAK